MSAKYCKEYRCESNNGKPCAAADDCFLFKWDIDRERGNKPTLGNPLEAQE